MLKINKRKKLNILHAVAFSAKKQISSFVCTELYRHQHAIPLRRNMFKTCTMIGGDYLRCDARGVYSRVIIHTKKCHETSWNAMSILRLTKNKNEIFFRENVYVEAKKCWDFCRMCVPLLKRDEMYVKKLLKVYFFHLYSATPPKENPLERFWVRAMYIQVQGQARD